MEGFDIAIVDATDIVGQEIVKVRDFDGKPITDPDLDIDDFAFDLDEDKLNLLFSTM